MLKFSTYCYSSAVVSILYVACKKPMLALLTDKVPTENYIAQTSIPFVKDVWPIRSMEINSLREKKVRYLGKILTLPGKNFRTFCQTLDQIQRVDRIHSWVVSMNNVLIQSNNHGHIQSKNLKLFFDSIFTTESFAYSEYVPEALNTLLLLIQLYFDEAQKTSLGQ